MICPVEIARDVSALRAARVGDYAPACRTYELVQDVEFHSSKIDRLRPRPNLPGLPVYPQVVGRKMKQPIRARLARSPQHGANARQKFIRIKRLRQIIIGS